MDRNLIEKITRLVVSKLEEQAEHRPLTDEEIKRWNEITSSMKVTENKRRQSTLTPLTDKEIEVWNSITSSMKDTMTTAPFRDEEQEKEQVKFIRHAHF